MNETNEFLKIPKYLDLEWKNLSSETRKEVIQIFEIQIKEIRNGKTKHDPLIYTSVEGLEVLRFFMKPKEVTGDFYYELSEIERKPINETPTQ
jgi:hypothetical protein